MLTPSKVNQVFIVFQLPEDVPNPTCEVDEFRGGGNPVSL